MSSARIRLAIRSGINRTLVALLAAAALIAFVPLAVRAQRVVNNTDDSGGGSLRATIAHCTSGPLVFNNPCVTTMTVQAPGGANLALNGKSAEVFNITSRQTIEISGLTIDGGVAFEPPVVLGLWTATGTNGGGVWNDGA